MLNTQMKRHQLDRDFGKKVMRFSAVTFFLCALATHQTYATTNLVTGTAYGTNDWTTAPSISSQEDGDGSLTIGFAGTTNVTINNNIDGTIIVNNGFANFAINADSSAVSNSAYAVLAVTGGTNLNLNGGTYQGTVGGGGITLPPIPGVPPQTNDVSSAAVGGIIVDTESVTISRTDFAGATFFETSGRSFGTDGLLLFGTDVVFQNDGVNSPTLTGGDGGTVNSSSDAVSLGGTALYAEDTLLTISNGTFRGGNGGTVTTTDSATAATAGGAALFATNSTVDILEGTFTGGSAGSATASASGTAESVGGAALYAGNSDITIATGTFTGGTAGSEAHATGGAGIVIENGSLHVSGAAEATGGKSEAALVGIDSDLTIDAGTFTGGDFDADKYFGLVSIASSGEVNTVTLNAGRFNSVDFAGDGTQWVTAGTNLVVEDFFVVDGGSIMVNNLSDDAFQNSFIRGGFISFSNGFTLADGGLFTLENENTLAQFTNLEITSNATVSIGLNQITAAGNVALHAYGMINISAASSNSLGTIHADEVLFHTNSTINVDASLAGFSAGTNNLEIVTSDSGISIINDSGTNSVSSGSNLTENVNISATSPSRTRLSDVLSDGNNVQLQFTSDTLRDYLGFEGQAGELADELDASGNTEMLTLIDQYETSKQAAAAIEQTYFSMFNSFQTALHGMRVAVGPSISRGTEFREQLMLIPVGARGPARRNDVRGWGKYYGQYLTHDKEGINPEYETYMHGGVVGIDKSFNNLLLGVSGGAGSYRTSYDPDASEDVTAAHGMLFGTYGAEHGYIDTGIAYGHNRVKTKTADPFELEGKYDAEIISAYLAGGYDLLDTKGGTGFTPEASIQYAQYQQDAYTETGTAAVPRMFDEFDSESIMTSLGVNISMLNAKRTKRVGFKLEGRIHWMHEFSADSDDATFRLVGGSNRYDLAYPSLDENIYRLGFGCSFFNTERHKPKNVLLRLDFDELFGDGFNSHNLAAKLIYAF